MKVLLLSDSHGLTKELEDIRNRHKDEVDFLLHCGDSELPAASSALAPYKGVRGNCDFDSGLPNEIIEDINGNTLYMTHGHLYNVKVTLMNLKYRALEVNAKIVCYGHTHIAGAEIIDNIVLINPGSIRLPMVRKQKTYAILNVEESLAKITFYEVNGQEVKEMSKQFTLEQ